MCGRYTVISNLQAIEARFNALFGGPDFDVFNVNVSPGNFAPVITDAESKKIQMFQFGFTPFWAKKKMYVINARSEGDHNKEDDPAYTGAMGIINKPMFRKSIRQRRCLVIVDAFIEGSKLKRLNEPFLIYRRDGEHPFALAGIWDEWVNKETAEVHHSFAIITTQPNDLLQKVGHHRSPVILDKADESKWLDPNADLREVTELLRPFDATEFNAYPISPDIKSPKAGEIVLLKPTGDRIYKEYEYVLYDKLKLEGMGESPARQRRMKEDGE